MENCHICGKKLGLKEGFGSGVDKSCRVPKNKADEIIVCSKNCMKKFESSFAHQGKPIDHYSRVTGYMQKVSGWNEGKKQEFFDRKRYTVT